MSIFPFSPEAEHKYFLSIYFITFLNRENRFYYHMLWFVSYDDFLLIILLSTSYS